MKKKIERSAEALRGVPPPDHLSLQKKPCNKGRSYLRKQNAKEWLEDKFKG